MFCINKLKQLNIFEQITELKDLRKNSHKQIERRDMVKLAFVSVFFEDFKQALSNQEPYFHPKTGCSVYLQAE